MIQFFRGKALACVLPFSLCFSPSPLIAQDQTAPVAQGVGNEVPISQENLWESEGSLSRHVTVRTDPLLLRNPVAKRHELASELVYLNQLTARGFAAGLTGVLYDNRDRKHSTITPERLYPQLTATLYSPALKARNQDYGLAGDILFSLPTIGNSSTALTRGYLARSQSRKALETEYGAMRAYEQYTSNHIYVYPEHKDHDSATGDKFFANTPYMITSQGSSGSDQDFLQAIAAIIAAFTPSTRFEAERSARISPTVQMVLRRTMVGIESDDDYLSGRAHPSAFDGKKIDLAGAIALAHSLTPEALPPIVRLKVEQDFKAQRGVDYLENNRSEAIFTSPSAISRVWRSYAYERELEISIVPPAEPASLPTTYHWKILRGDPEKISIIQSKDGLSAKIRMQWHEPFPTPDQPDMLTSRIDIGVFADNGETISAPAFVTVALPTHQFRQYTEGSDGQMRLSGLSYLPSRETYADPIIWPVASWSDTLKYSDDGELTGISRLYSKGETVDFSVGEKTLQYMDEFGTRQENFQIGRTDKHGVFWIYDTFTKPKSG